jgi:hypothetical protein
MRAAVPLGRPRRSFRPGICRTSLDALGSNPKDVEAAERWRRSPLYKMLQTGDSLLRLRLNAKTVDEFSWLDDLLAAGMTEYVAIITRFAADGVIGEMDGLYSNWATSAPGGFDDGHIAALERIAGKAARRVFRRPRTTAQTWDRRGTGRGSCR